MKRTLFFFILGVCMLIATACSGALAQGGDVEPPISPAPRAVEPARAGAATGTFFAINEVGLGPDGYVALTNFTDVPASLSGLYLCQGAQCFELPDAVVDAGQTVRVATGSGAGLEGVVATRATLGELRPSDGEIALVTAPALDDPHQILVYFQWGSSPHPLTQTAIDAGLWVKDGYGPTSQRATRLYQAQGSGLWLFEEP